MSRFLRFRRPSKPAVFSLLMAASLVMILLPTDLLGPARNATQLVAPLQLVTLEATRRVIEPIRTLTRHGAMAQQHADLALERQALENENVGLRQKIARLQSTIDGLTGIRRRGFPARGVLIPARIISRDAAPGRESLLVGKGHVHHVNERDWVVSRLEVDAGTAEGVRDASAVLARQCLIGWVGQTAPLTSRIVLLSDRLTSKPLRVHLVCRTTRDGKNRLLTVKDKPVAFALEGAGGGRMRIRDIPASLVDAGQVRVGDLVTSDANDPKLPQAMVIGQIEELNLNRTTPVHYDALLRYLYDPKTLSQVFIADLSKAGTRTSPPGKP